MTKMGKTQISINRIDIITVFNVGEYRRAATDKYRNHAFFDMANAEAVAIRQ
jgi:6-phosphofructo-2-kinase/fructose-2,6-biphosphatase 2